MVQRSFHIPCKRYWSKMNLKLDEINHPKTKQQKYLSYFESKFNLDDNCSWSLCLCQKCRKQNKLK